MSHHANDPYIDAGIDVSKHSDKEAHDLLTKKKKVVTHMRKFETKASKVFPKEFRRYSPGDRLKHELKKDKYK